MTASQIPLGDLQREYARIRPEIDRAIERVLRRGCFILGDEVEAFEAERADYCGAAHSVAVGNGTDAIQLALRAAGVGPGDEVVVPALTATFTALAVSMTGATPVFADIDRLGASREGSHAAPRRPAEHPPARTAGHQQPSGRDPGCHPACQTLLSRRLEQAAADPGGALRLGARRLSQTNLARRTPGCRACLPPVRGAYAAQGCPARLSGVGYGHDQRALSLRGAPQKAYTHLGYEPDSYPNAAEAAAQVLSLPVFPQLSDQEAKQVIRLIRICLVMR